MDNDLFSVVDLAKLTLNDCEIDDKFDEILDGILEGMNDITKENIRQLKETIVQDVASQISSSKLLFDPIVKEATNVEKTQEEKATKVPIIEKNVEEEVKETTDLLELIEQEVSKLRSQAESVEETVKELKGQLGSIFDERDINSMIDNFSLINQMQILKYFLQEENKKAIIDLISQEYAIEDMADGVCLRKPYSMADIVSSFRRSSMKSILNGKSLLKLQSDSIVKLDPLTKSLYEVEDAPLYKEELLEILQASKGIEAVSIREMLDSKVMQNIRRLSDMDRSKLVVSLKDCSSTKKKIVDTMIKKFRYSE